jgi:glycosyltransferase involved in cell wall biosynthesis
MTKASIIFLSSNHEAFVAEALQSALQQDYPEYELVIHDDGSTDSTLQIINDILSKGVPPHIKILLIGDGTNHGILEAHNRAFGICTGEVVVVFNADDISSRNRLSRHVDIYQKYPDVMLIISAVNRINHFGFLYKTTDSENKDIIYSHEKCNDDIYAGSPVLGAAASYRKDVLSKFKPFKKGWAHAEDNILWVRALILGKIYFTHERLVQYRLHATNFSDSPERWKNGPDLITQRKHIETLNKYSLNSLQWNQDIQYALENNYILARTALRFTKLANRHALRWKLLSLSLSDARWSVWFKAAFNTAQNGGLKKCISMLIMRISKRRKKWYWQKCVKRAQLELEVKNRA